MKAEKLSLKEMQIQYQVLLNKSKEIDSEIREFKKDYLEYKKHCNLFLGMVVIICIIALIVHFINK